MKYTSSKILLALKNIKWFKLNSKFFLNFWRQYLSVKMLSIIVEKVTTDNIDTIVKTDDVIKVCYYNVD